MINNENIRLRTVLENEIFPSLSPKVKSIISQVPDEHLMKIEEIRMRLGKPLMIHSCNMDYMISSSGQVTDRVSAAYKVSREDCEKTMQLISNYSIYAIEEELRSGYITLKGGHRVGIVGKCILDAGKVKALKNISGFNVRIARQVIGAADSIISYIIKSQYEAFNTLIVSPPQCGKTTLLRDIIRQLSNGIPGTVKGMKIGLVDERSEIAGCYQGMPQNDIGCRTDVLDACPKSYGLIMLIRSMSPQIVATDEIGSSSDMEAIYEALNSGTRIITTIHGESLEDILKRPFISEIVRNRIFERIIMLSSKQGPGTIEEVIDGSSFKPILNTPFR